MRSVGANYMPHMRRRLPELNRTFLTSLSRISTDRSEPSAQSKWSIGGHRPLLLEAGALACTDPDEWLRELGKRKIDSLIVESDEAFERLSMACQKDRSAICALLAVYLAYTW